MIIWFIGLSGSGKTTLAQHLYDHLKPQYTNLIFLDGDTLRDVWGEKMGHDIGQRRLNHTRISELCKVLDQQGIHVIAAALSIFPDLQSWNREMFSRYFEIYLDVPMSELGHRDDKDLYGKYARGEINNVVGGDIPFPTPINPDLIIQPPHSLDPPDVILQKILQVLPKMVSEQ